MKMNPVSQIWLYWSSGVDLTYYNAIVLLGHKEGSTGLVTAKKGPPVVYITACVGLAS